MAQEQLTGGLPMVSDPQSNPFTFDLKKWLDEHGFAPDTNINKDPVTGAVTKNGVPYTPTAEETKILNTPPKLFPGFPSFPSFGGAGASSAILGIGLLALVLLIFKK